MKNIYIISNGCFRRGLDAKRIADYFSKNDYELVKKPEKADIIIFLACASSHAMETMSFNTIKNFSNYKGELVIGGCLPAILKEKLDNSFNGKKFITKEIEKIDNLFPKNKVKFKDIDDANSFYLNLNNHNRNFSFEIKNFLVKNYYGSKSFIYNDLFNPKNRENYFFLRISWGCNNSCAYCAIKKAIGFHKSKSIEECVNEFKKGLDQGYKYFQIEGDDTGAYGLDNGSNITDLLDRITRIPGDYAIFISNFHPKWVIRYLSELEKIIKRKKISNILIPLQSGSNRILDLMHRGTSIEKTVKAIKVLKRADPDLKIATHFIVGFPTETNEDFQQTLRVAEEIQFSAGFFINFTNQKGTVANKIYPKISKNDKNVRLKTAKKFLAKQGYKAVFYGKKNGFFFDKNDFFENTIKYIKCKKAA